MKITKKSQLSGKEHTLDLDVTQEQLDRFNKGYMVQDVFPHLTGAEREFILTGITGEEWDEEFKNEDDDEERGEFLSQEGWGKENG